MIASASDLFDVRLPAALASGTGAMAVAGPDVTIGFRVTGEGGGEWTVVLGDSARVEQGIGEPARLGCCVEASASDLLVLAADKSKVMQLYFEGRIKVSGNVMLAAKIQKVLALVD